MMRITYLLFLLLALINCTSNQGRRNDLRPLTDNSFDDEYQQHIVITDDSVQPFTLVENEACLHVDLPQKMTETCLDTIFSSYKFIPLETREECIIGQITKIIKCPGCYCILDRDNANVFLFEEDGKFRCKLGSKGHAGNEHIDAWNVAYDSKNEYVVMLDLTGRRMLSYNLNGKLQKVTPLYFLYTDMAFIGDGLVCKTGTAVNRFSDVVDLSRLVYADSLQRPQRVDFPTSERRRSEFCYDEFMTQSGDRAYFTDMISDTLWEVSSKRKSPFVVMTAGGKSRFSPEEQEYMTDKLYMQRNEHLTYVYDFFITKDYVVLHMGIPGSSGGVGNLICSRSTGRRKFMGKPVGMKRFGDYMSMNGLNGVHDNSTLIRVLNPTTTFLTDIQYDLSSVSTMTAEEKSILMNVQPDDNPVLMLEHLVNF